jgi:hypothetical protein
MRVSLSWTEADGVNVQQVCDDSEVLDLIPDRIPYARVVVVYLPRTPEEREICMQLRNMRIIEDADDEKSNE